jgi:lysylphosphatidylglycerol synthase-like protein
VTARQGLHAAAAVAGVLLFAQSLRVLGLERVLDGLARVGWGFIAIVVLSGAREAVRTLAWMRTVEGPVPLRFGQAFRARLIGEALNTLLPMGMVVGEPAKAAHAGFDIPFAAAFRALIVEFAFYGLSLVLLFGAGFSAFFLASDLRLRIPAVSLWLALPLGAAVVCAVVWSRVRQATGRQGRSHGRGSSASEWVAERLRHLGEVVFGFASRHPEHVGAIVAFEIAYQMLAVAEVYCTLQLVSPVQPSLASAVVLETVSRAITMVFKFLPMRVGVDEVGSSVAAAQVQLSGATGLTLALVRKLRLLFWSAIGLLLSIGSAVRSRDLALSSELW